MKNEEKWRNLEIPKGLAAPTDTVNEIRRPPQQNTGSHVYCTTGCRETGASTSGVILVKSLYAAPCKCRDERLLLFRYKI
jgi:hypothetical protein